MVFSSLQFIFIFLPLFLLVYFTVPNKYRNSIILLGSVVFYIVGSWGHPHYLLLIALSICVNYIIGRQIEKNKKFLILGLIYNLGYLFVFKYCDFALSIIGNIANTEFTSLNLLLPIGISFYTFQSISYLVDIHQGKNGAEKSIIGLARYILMFPQLISGPLVRYDEIKNQAENRVHTIDGFAQGCKYFILGLGFKVLLANRIGILWNEILKIGFDGISTQLAWLGAIGYSLQIYFDFAGYSLMAIGLGKMIGFELPENFDAPYLSKSMTEFFRRWHMSLGNWFKHYLYIPLGGNRKGIVRTVLNLLVVWLFTGLWHGASINFVLWGVAIFFFIALEKLVLKKWLDKYPVLGHIYMMVLIPLMWTIFAITDLEQLKVMFSRMFTGVEGLYPLDYIKYAKTYGLLLIAGIVCCTKLPERFLLKKENSVLELIILLVIFWTASYYVYMGVDNTFLYFNF